MLRVLKQHIYQLLGLVVQFVVRGLCVVVCTSGARGCFFMSQSVQTLPVWILSVWARSEWICLCGFYLCRFSLCGFCLFEVPFRLFSPPIRLPHKRSVCQVVCRGCAHNQFEPNLHNHVAQPLLVVRLEWHNQAARLKTPIMCGTTFFGCERFLNTFV